MTECGETTWDMDGDTHAMSPSPDLVATSHYYAASLMHLADGYRAMDVVMTSKQKTRWREAMGTTIRKFQDIVLPAFAPFGVSAAADERSPEGVDLRHRGWHQQASFDPGRVVFQFEHYWTVSHLVAQVLSAESTDAVEHLLVHEGLWVVWVLKEEDGRLRTAGKASKRPDPAAAYQEVGIELRHLPGVAAV